MPIYEYECKKCGAQVEKMQKMADKPLTKCTKCGGRLEKQWSSTSFQLKGTGWYVTDYAAKKSDGKSETKASTTEEKTSKSEEKTAKSDVKSNTTKPEASSSEKTAPAAKKSPSKNASSNSGGD